jgi:hypothetical protein
MKDFNHSDVRDIFLKHLGRLWFIHKACNMRIKKGYNYANIVPGNLVKIESHDAEFIDDIGEIFIVRPNTILMFLGVEVLDEEIGAEISTENEITWFLHCDKIYMGLMPYSMIEDKNFFTKVET